MNGTEAGCGALVLCPTASDLAVDEASGSVYWIVLEGFKPDMTFNLKMMRGSINSEAITKLFETELSPLEGNGVNIRDPVAGDGHLYWNTAYLESSASETWLSHANTSDNSRQDDFVPGERQAFGVLGGDLYANGSIVKPNGDVVRIPALPPGAVPATVDAPTSFPPYRPCTDAQAQAAKAKKKLARLSRKLKKAAKQVKAAKRALAKAARDSTKAAARRS